MLEYDNTSVPLSQVLFSYFFQVLSAFFDNSVLRLRKKSSIGYALPQQIVKLYIEFKPATRSDAQVLVIGT